MQLKTPDGADMQAAADKAALAALGLAGLGLVLATTVASLELGFGNALFRHGRKLVVALFALLVLTRLRSEHLSRAARPAFLVTLGLVLAAALFFPAEYGASRWIKLGGAIRFQPTEVAKIGLMLYTAFLAARATSTRELYKALWPTVVLVLVLFLQPDIGSALLCALVGAAIVVVAGLPAPHLISLAGGGVAVSGLAWLTMPHVRARIAGFLDPVPGSQVDMSLVALGNGGLFGTGLGQGEIKLGHLVKCGNDFVFAIVGEEMGLLGTLGVLALLALFGWYGLRIAAGATDRFLGLLAFGVVFGVVVQALAHVAVGTAMAPAKGIDFPFLGSGGSSLVFAMGSVGLLRAVARCSGGGEVRTLLRPRRILGGNVANVERYGVMALCFLIVVILGVSLFGPDPEPVHAGRSAGGPEQERLVVDDEVLKGIIDDTNNGLEVNRQPRQVEEVDPPAPRPRPVPTTRIYRVRRGESLSIIAQRQCGTVKAMKKIRALNPEIGDGSRLQIGQRLVLPARRR